MAQRVRSPKAPFIDLETAIQRAETFYEAEKRNSASIPVAMEKWGYKDESSGGFQTISTLKEFGLMEDTGNKDARRVKLTDRALRIILDKREDSGERDQLIKESALLPKTYSTLWQMYHGDLPSDSNLRHYLMFDYHPPFNENAVDSFITQFKATVAFAKLNSSDTISLGREDKKDEREGPSGMPLKESVVQDPPPPALVVTPAHTLPVPPAPTATRQDIFSLDEGPVTIQWPASLSKESFNDLAAWMDILKRKIGRSVIVHGQDHENE